MNVPTVSKSKLATISLVLVVISYLVLFLLIFLDVSDLDTTLGINKTMKGITGVTLRVIFWLDFWGFVSSIIALVFIKKYNLLGRKTALVSLIGSILLPILFIGLFILVLSSIRLT